MSYNLSNGTTYTSLSNSADEIELLGTSPAIDGYYWIKIDGWTPASASFKGVFNFTVEEDNSCSSLSITFLYPNGTYNETYKDYNRWVNFTTNILQSSPAINNTGWVLNSTNGTLHSFYNSNTSLSNGIYSLNCSTNETSAIVTFTIDSTSPDMTSTLEGNTTYITSNKTYQINYTDNNMLWGFNISIDNVLIYNISNIQVDSYIYNGTINGSNYTFGAHTLTSTVCDAHTDNYIDYFNIYRDKDTLKVDNIGIKSTSKVDTITYIKETDRYNFCFYYDTPQEYIIVEISPVCVYQEKSKYDQHYVCGNKWLDFENNDNFAFNYATNNPNILTIIPDKPTDRFCFNSIGQLNCNTESYLWNKGGRLNISAYDVSNGSYIPVNAFSVYVNGAYDGNTTTGTYNIDDLTNTTYNISIFATGFGETSNLIAISKDYEEYNFTMFPTNSLTINLYNEDTLNSLNGTNVTMDFSSIFTTFTNITDTGTFYIQNLTATEYTITFSATDYSDREYVITISNSSHSSLNVYLIPNASNTIFTISDYDSGVLLEGVSCTMYKAINGSYVVIESKTTDITGRTQFSYLEGADYRFQLSKSGYEDYIFELTPILFESYDIKMRKTTTEEEFGDYDRVSIYYAPHLFIDGMLNNFTFNIGSPYGELVSYGFIATYPNGVTTESGSNAIGEQFNSVFNISGANFGDTLDLIFYYESSVYGLRNFTYKYPISFEGANQTTMITNRDRTYGLGVFERLLFVTLFIIIVVGISTLIGRTAEGLAFGLFLMGLFVYIGFIPLLSVIISIFAGLILITAKGGL